MDFKAGLPILAFASAEDFERWLADQPGDAAGAWLKIARKGSGGRSLSKAEAIDTALCNGWIDGQLDRCDESHFLVRFTPRRQASAWSQVNRDRAEDLIVLGRMRPAGLAEIERARADGRWQSAYPPASRAVVPPDLQEALDARPDAAAFFATLKGANRYAILYRIGAAKRPETRSRRIADFVAMLERGETFHG